MFCQACGAFNADESAEFCNRCQAKLMVVSGPAAELEEETASAEEIPLDEHLLERISALEEVVKREGDMIRGLYDALQRLEKNFSIAQTGILALQETLEQRGVLSHGETAERWQALSEARLHAVEMKDRFLDRRERILGGFSGPGREGFVQKIRDAEFAILSLDPESGMRLLEEAFRLDRGNADLGFFLAESHFSEGDFAHASNFLKKVLASNPNHYETLLYLGIVASESGDDKTAEAYLRRAIEVKAEGFLPHFALGGLLARQGRLDAAREELLAAREIAPLAAARVLLGQVERERGETSTAIEEFEAALKDDPRSQEAHFQLGLAYLEKNRPRKALEEFQRALEINPRRLDVQEAVRLLERRSLSGLPAVSGPAEPEFKKAEECVAAGQFRQALEHYRESLKQDPANGSILISYAMLCASQGMSREAIAACRKILSGHSEEMIASAACSTLAEVLRAEGETKEAARVVKDFLKSYDSPAARTIGYYELASSLAETDENLNEALDYATRSLEAAPDELKPFSLAALGWVYFKKKEYDSAIDLLKRSSDSAATPLTLHRLGMAYLAAGMSEESKSAFKRAKTMASRGARLEERILEQVRLNLKMSELAATRRKI